MLETQVAVELLRGVIIEIGQDQHAAGAVFVRHPFSKSDQAAGDALPAVGFEDVRLDLGEGPVEKVFSCCQGSSVLSEPG